MLRTLVPASLVLAAAVFAPNAHAAVPAVTWRLDQPYVIAGSGCHNNIDAFAAANGDDLSLVFTNLGVDMPAGEPDRLSDAKSCLVRIPAILPKGMYVGQFDRIVPMGVTKSAGSRGWVSSSLSFFGIAFPPISAAFPHGIAEDNPLLVAHSESNTLVNTPAWQRWCDPNRSEQGLLQLYISVSGQRDNTNENLIVYYGQELDTHSDMTIAVYNC
jgi:hypothetical protein